MFSPGFAQANIEEESYATPSHEPMEDMCAELYEVDYVYTSQKNVFAKTWNEITAWCKKNNVADRLDAGISLGTMGIGIQVKTPITKWVNLRAGVDWLPTITLPMHFNLRTYTDGESNGYFSHVQEMLYNHTGIEMDEIVDMKARGHMINFKLMADVFPFQNNRHWYFTAGFFAGNSQIGKAVNYPGEKPTLVGLNVYNRGYEYFTHIESIYDVPLGGGTYMDPDLVVKIRDKFIEYGRMGVNIGDFKDGEQYIMEPAPDGSVTAKALVNHFKPFLGAGYSTDLDLEGKWHLDVNLGAIFWGGAPDIINHDWQTGKDINFTKDLINIKGKVGDYMKIVKAFPVYPLLEISFSYSFL